MEEERFCVFCVCSVLGDTVTWDVGVVVSVGDEEGGELRECAARGCCKSPNTNTLLALIHLIHPPHKS